MYKICFYSILFSFTFSGINFAQETSKKWIPDEFSVTTGFDIQNNILLSEEEWDRLLLISGYPFSTENTGLYMSARSQVGVQFGYTKPLQTTSNRWQFSTRFGYSRSQSMNTYNYSGRDSTFRYDTLTLSSTGEQFFLDSVHTKGYSRSFDSDLEHIARVQGILRYQFKPRFSGYVGIGLGLGFTTNQRSELAEFNAKSAQKLNLSEFMGYYLTGNNQTSTSTSIRTIDFGTSLSTIYFQIPVGFDFQLSKKSEFFKKMSVGLELNYQYSAFRFPNVYRWFSNHGLMSQFSVRYVVN